MKYVFFGTPDFAAIILDRLLEAGLPPELVVCNPDRPVGKKKVVTAPPTKILAQQYELPIWQPEKMTAGVAEKKFAGCQFAIVATYAQIIKKEIIALFPKGIVGIHFSLLPKYRGPSPVQSAILAGEPEIATTFSLMDEKLDHGPILLQEKTLISPEETRTDLDNRLAVLSGKLLANMLPDFVTGKIIPREQDHNQASYTKKFFTEDGRIDFRKDDPEMISRKIRALNPEPGVFTYLNEKRVKLLEANYANGKLRLTKIQIAGKTPRELSEREQQELFKI
jgi:methionyl-tRNA formyltransferase